MKKIIEGNGVKIFLLKLLVFTATVTVADLIIGTILKKTYFKQQQGYDYLTTFSITKANDPVLIFGSSRAVNIFNPAVMEKELNLSCFNAGRIGQSIFYHYAVLKSVLKRYNPKKIILSFDAGNFDKDQEDYDRLSSLLPYYESIPEIEPIVNLKGPYEKIKTISTIYPYNSLLLPILNGNMKKENSYYSNIKGFMPIKKNTSSPVRTIDYTKKEAMDSKKIDTYKAFISDCIRAGIELHIVCPPYLVDAIGTDVSIETAKKIATEYKIDFIDYSRDSFYLRQPQLFADFRHLNGKGADLFSEQVAEKIGNK